MQGRTARASLLVSLGPSWPRSLPAPGTGREGPVIAEQFTSNHVTVSADGKGRFRRIPFRYAWPAEMDLMARIAGLSLKYRWAGWDRSAFTAESTTHVSIRQKR